MNLVRTLLALCGLALAALIVFAIQTGDFWTAVAWLTTDPWGLTSLADLYLGLLISAVIIGLYERRWSAIYWIAPLPFLGNVWTIVWLIYRLPQLARKLGNAT